MSKNILSMLQGLGRDGAGSAMGAGSAVTNPLMNLFSNGNTGQKGPPVMDAYQNPGQKMFGMPADGGGGSGGSPNFMSRFGKSLSEQLFERAMQGYMGGY